LLIICVIIVSLAVVILLYYAINDILIPKPQLAINKFKIKEIYPTKQGGRQWYINMNNPKEDPIFTIVSNIPITRSDDGSWFIANYSSRR
jgi:hypothetical protein